jgi:hypothetical protein
MRAHLLAMGLLTILSSDAMAQPASPTPRLPRKTSATRARGTPTSTPAPTPAAAPFPCASRVSTALFERCYRAAIPIDGIGPDLDTSLFELRALARALRTETTVAQDLATDDGDRALAARYGMGVQGIERAISDLEPSGLPRTQKVIAMEKASRDVAIAGLDLAKELLREADEVYLCNVKSGSR